MPALNIVVLVSGRGTNLQALIDASKSRDIQSKITAVVSNKEEAFALKRAEEAQISTHTVPSKGKSNEEFQAELLKTVKNLNPDLIVLAGFMRILGKIGRAHV